jgi:hypothetical protein
VESTAHVIRASLLAIATINTLRGARISSDVTHAPIAMRSRLDRKTTDSVDRAFFPESRAVSTGGRNTGLQFTSRSFEAQGFPWALIEAQGYLVEFGLRINR